MPELIQQVLTKHLLTLNTDLSNIVKNTTKQKKT